MQVTWYHSTDSKLLAKSMNKMGSIYFGRLKCRYLFFFWSYSRSFFFFYSLLSAVLIVYMHLFHFLSQIVYLSILRSSYLSLSLYIDAYHSSSHMRRISPHHFVSIATQTVFFYNLHNKRYYLQLCLFLFIFVTPHIHLYFIFVR